MKELWNSAKLIIFYIYHCDLWNTTTLGFLDTVWNHIILQMSGNLGQIAKLSAINALQQNRN